MLILRDFLSVEFSFILDMSKLGGVVGGAVGAIGSIFGGISASKAMKRVKNNLQAQRQANQDWFNRRYNEDATQRADAQAILSRTEEALRARTRAAAGAQAVAGGTEESVAATKASSANALAEAASQIAVNGERRKDSIESEARALDSSIAGQLNDLERQKAGNVTQAAMGVAQAGANIADSF